MEPDRHGNRRERKFNLKEEINVDDLLGRIETQRVEKIAAGVSETEANKWAEIFARNAPDTKLFVEMENRTTMYIAAGAVHLSAREEKLGVGKVLSYDDSGQVKVGAFELKDNSGLRLLTLDTEGNLTTYNSDGSIRSQKSKADLLTQAYSAAGNGYVLDAKRAGVDLQTADFF